MHKLCIYRCLWGVGSKLSSEGQEVLFSTKRRSLAVLSAAAAAAILGSAARAATTYTWGTFNQGDTASWDDGTRWTVTGGNASNYPGGDKVIVDDAAVITGVGNMGA